MSCRNQDSYQRPYPGFAFDFKSLESSAGVHTMKGVVPVTDRQREHQGGPQARGDKRDMASVEGERPGREDFA